MSVVAPPSYAPRRAIRTLVASLLAIVAATALSAPCAYAVDPDPPSPAPQFTPPDSMPAPAGGAADTNVANPPRKSIRAEDLRGIGIPIDNPSYRSGSVAALGLDNVGCDADGHAVAFENRRFRHSAYARGRLAGRFVQPWVAAIPGTFFERRLGLVAAAVVDTSEPAIGSPNRDRGGVPDAVHYPSDRNFPPAPAGPVLNSTRWATDLELVPLFTYELGRILDPVLIRLEMEPRVRMQLWPGARATASLVIPVRNDFAADSLHPDLNRVRPGPVTLEQFRWIPGAALVSGTAGLFADNRYGVSVGAARPLAEGAFLLDAQADFTGYIAFPSTGAEYSGIERFTGFAGVSWRAPRIDTSVRLRAERFIYGDQGAELEVRRTMGDLELAFFFEHTGGFNVHGVRVLVPVPPAVRRHAVPMGPGLPLRVLPVDQVPLSYRDQAAPAGRAIRNVASREDFLRQLSQPGLAANAYRYREARGWPSDSRSRAEGSRVSLTGMTGFVNTPWCGVIADRGVEVGYNHISKGAAYDHRGLYSNDVYYATLGFLPHIEAGLRWTVIPGLKAFSDIVPDSRLTDSDRMLSGRVEVLPPRPGRPGLAFGVEDAVGTRRFHSTYAVSGVPFEYQRLHARLAVGYAPQVFTASRYTLDGAFGAVEASLWRPLAVSLEYDTEKWNTSLGIDLGFGLRARAALLGGKHTSIGAGWFLAL